MPDIFIKHVVFESFNELVTLVKNDERFKHQVHLRYNGTETCGDVEIEYGRNFFTEEARKEFRVKLTEIIKQM